MTTRWETKTLGEICTIKPPKAQAKLKLAESDEVSFVPMEDLGIGVKYLQPVRNRRLGDVSGSYTYFADGDVLLAKITPCFENGKLGIARGLTNGIGFGSSEYIVLRPKASLDAEFLYYYLARPSFLEEGSRTMTGAVGHKRVTKEFVEGYSIPLPPLSEQRRIVAILDEAFERIANAKAIAERNVQNAGAVFDGRLESTCTQCGPGFRQQTLGEVCDLFQGLAINVKSKHLLVAHSTLPLLRIKDLRENSSEQFVAEIGFPPNAKVDESDILYTRTGQVGLVFRGREGVLHNNCFKVRPREGLRSDYLFWWLQAPSFRQKISALAGKAAQPDIAHSVFKAQLITIPPLDFQDEETSKLDELANFTKELACLYTSKLAALDELKKSLLQQAFTGAL